MMYFNIPGFLTYDVFAKGGRSWQSHMFFQNIRVTQTNVKCVSYTCTKTVPRKLDAEWTFLGSEVYWGTKWWWGRSLGAVWWQKPYSSENPRHSGDI